MRTHTILRYTARICSIATCLFICAFVFGGKESLRPATMQMVGLLFFPIGLLVGFMISWRREAAGAMVSLGSLAAFFGWLLIRDGRLPGFPGWFLVLAGPAFLFLANALLSRRTSPAAGCHGAN